VIKFDQTLILLITYTSYVFVLKDLRKILPVCRDSRK